MKLGKILNTIITLLFIPFISYAYVGDAFVTPDTWGKHVSPSGVKSFTNGMSFGDFGILKMGYTTRIKLKFSDESDWAIYEYTRLSLSGTKVGNGELNINLNMRGAYDDSPTIGDRNYHKFYDGLYAARSYNEFTRQRKSLDGDFRIYQANLELNKVVPLTDITFGRMYLAAIDGYKIDGLKFKVDPSQYINIDIYYGLPVSYYSNLKTQVVGANIEIPLDATGTKIQAAYSYFISEDGGNYNTGVARLRLDQALSFNILAASIYAEGDVIGNAFLYDIGVDANIYPSKTGVSAYIQGQASKNDDPINNYVSLYEGMLGSSAYIMGGLKITQAIKDFLLIGVGYEGRYNMSISYGDRDYNRVFGNVDLVGLIHKNNYLSFIVDYYNVAALGHQNASSKVVGGFRMTQVFTDRLEAWLGVNVQNFQYRNSPIRMKGMNNGFDEINQRRMNENTTLAYIGAMYKPVDWCALQLDYTFEYADLFKSADLQPDIHTIELWVNFVW